MSKRQRCLPNREGESMSDNGVKGGIRRGEELYGGKLEGAKKGREF